MPGPRLLVSATMSPNGEGDAGGEQARETSEAELDGGTYLGDADLGEAGLPSARAGSADAGAR